MAPPITDGRVWLLPDDGGEPVEAYSLTWHWVGRTLDEMPFDDIYSLEGTLSVSPSADVPAGMRFQLAFERPHCVARSFLVTKAAHELVRGELLFSVSFGSIGLPIFEVPGGSLPPRAEPAQEMTTGQLRQLLGGAAGDGAAAFDAEGGFRISPSAN